jgi:hypothetical protein
MARLKCSVTTSDGSAPKLTHKQRDAVGLNAERPHSTAYARCDPLVHEAMLWDGRKT